MQGLLTTDRIPQWGRTKIFAGASTAVTHEKIYCDESKSKNGSQNANAVARWFADKRVTQFLLTPDKLEYICPRNSHFCPKVCILAIFEQIKSLVTQLLPCWLVDWWLWHVGCISQYTYLLYVQIIFKRKKK